MGYKVDNAVIMAAGSSSRFAPISYEKPKALINVKGEILIERQIQQLLDKGISDIILVAGYKQEQLYYLKDKYNIIFLYNKDYSTRNNHSSIYVAKEYLRNTYICSSDNYFSVNPFEKEVDESYYSVLFSPDETEEWCVRTDKNDYITEIEIGGRNQWYMIGHVFWSEKFSSRFVQILKQIYDKEETKNKLWEDIYREYLQDLKMKIRRYNESQIYEFDSLDELRQFDSKYNICSGSSIMENLSKMLRCSEGEITNLKPLKKIEGDVSGVSFLYKSRRYQFLYETKQLVLL